MTRSILRVYSRLACGFWARTDARDVKLGAIAAWKLFGCPEWRRVPGPGANEDRKKEKRARDGLQNRCALDSFDPRTGQVNQGLSIRRPGRSWLIPPRPTFRRIVGSIRIFVFAASLVFALARSACFCAVLFNGSGVPRDARGRRSGKGGCGPRLSNIRTRGGPEPRCHPGCRQHGCVGISKRDSGCGS